MAERKVYETQPISLAERRAGSRQFATLYAEGMELVEEAAIYLDGDGRREAKKLGRLAATLYAAESMRLTTRLMQIASWLLLQRAVNSGEMTRDQVVNEKGKVHLDTNSAEDAADGWSELPETFRQLVRRSLQLQQIVRQMDQDIYGAGASELADNPVAEQIDRLKTAFGG